MSTIRFIRNWLAPTLAIYAMANADPEKSDSARKAESRAFYISAIKKKDPAQSGTLRDIYVHKLAGHVGKTYDPEVLGLFLDLIENDEDDRVRLEVAGVMDYLKIPSSMMDTVTAALKKSAQDERINFQVLASESLIEMAAKNGKHDLQALKTLVGIAQGQGMREWKVMIPFHNVNSKIWDPDTKTDIPYGVARKTDMRVAAIRALALSGDEISKTAIAGLTKDGSGKVREAALYYSRGNAPRTPPRKGDDP